MHNILDYSVQTLFDPVQTHAAYRVPSYAVDELKSVLKSEHAATRFRIVGKLKDDELVIVCFKLKSK